jgi:hypothetical protein
VLAEAHRFTGRRISYGRVGADDQRTQEGDIHVRYGRPPAVGCEMTKEIGFLLAAEGEIEDELR